MLYWDTLHVKILHALYKDAPLTDQELLARLRNWHPDLHFSEYQDAMTDLILQQVIMTGSELGSSSTKKYLLSEKGTDALLKFYKIWVFHDHSVFMILKTIRDRTLSHEELLRELKEWEDENLARHFIATYFENKSNGRGLSFFSLSTFHDKLRLLGDLGLVLKKKLPQKVGKQHKTEYQLTELGLHLLYFVVKDLKTFIEAQEPDHAEQKQLSRMNIKELAEPWSVRP